VAGGLGRHHPDVQIGTRHDLVVVHVETVGKHQRGALLDVGGHVVGVDIGDLLVGQQDHDHVCALDGVVDFHHVEAGLANLVPRGATLAQTHHHLDAAVVQVLRMGMTLAAVANDGYRLALDQAQITIFVVKNFHAHSVVKNI